MRKVKYQIRVPHTKYGNLPCKSEEGILISICGHKACIETKTGNIIILDLKYDSMEFAIPTYGKIQNIQACSQTLS